MPARRSPDITEDLNDDKSEITDINTTVASNADQINGGSAVWTFGQLRRGPNHLTSRIPK
jgi:hypothetical protein